MYLKIFDKHQTELLPFLRIIKRQQLAFHKDIDFSEPVDFIVNKVPEKKIKEFLTEKAISFL